VRALPTLLTADDPDEAKAVPQPAIRIHAARHAQAAEAQAARQVPQSRRVLPPPAVIDPDDVKTAPQPAIRTPVPDASPARYAPPGGQGRPPLTGASQRATAEPAPGARPPGYDEHGIAPGRWRRSPSASPPWPRVFATTARLWLTRRLPHRDRADKDSAVKDSAVRQHARSLPWIRAATLVLVVLLAAAGGVALSRHGKPGGKPTAPSNAVLTAQAARNEAAAWIAGQVSRNSIVSCDPVMCSVLQSRGYPVANLDVLGPNAPDPLDSSVIVATDALRSQFGGRLTSVYAPLTLASFGAGSAEVDVRVVAPDGARAYVRQLKADVAARKSLGTILLRDPKVAAEPAARRQLATGLVDPRLLLTISTMSALHPLSIVSFGGAAHGAAAGAPLREAVLIGGIGDSPADSGAGLAKLASFLRGQQPPYLPVAVQTVRLATGEHALRVQFAAPTPLGLMDPGHPTVNSPSS
jgi:hypothetical protein